MGFKTGIIGLPNVGKSTLFNALTKSNSAQAANFPFCTIDPNIGVVPVPDNRLENLAKNLEKDHADVRIRVSKFTNGPPVEFPVQVAIFGDDNQVLKILGERLKSIISKSPQVSDVFADQSASITGLEINLDEIDLAFSSKSSKEILDEISSSTRGLYISSMLDGNKEIPIRIKNNNIESKEINPPFWSAK